MWVGVSASIKADHYVPQLMAADLASPFLSHSDHIRSILTQSPVVVVPRIVLAVYMTNAYINTMELPFERFGLLRSIGDARESQNSCTYHLQRYYCSFHSF